jgi:hypothetical protein
MGRQGSLLLRESGFIDVEVIKDINGKDRILKGLKNG